MNLWSLELSQVYVQRKDKKGRSFFYPSENEVMESDDRNQGNNKNIVHTFIMCSRQSKKNFYIGYKLVRSRPGDDDSLGSGIVEGGSV